jgi:hypothetical protein
VNARRNVPRVEGARTPANRAGIAPCRWTSRSSMLSAPATMPATMLVTLAPAAAPALFFAPPSFTFCAVRRASPHRSASRITGTSPAYATRFVSSNAADTAEAAWEDCISRMHSDSVDTEP